MAAAAPYATNAVPTAGCPEKTDGAYNRLLLTYP